MIVSDDVDAAELVDYLTKTSFPDQSNGSSLCHHRLERRRSIG